MADPQNPEQLPDVIAAEDLEDPPDVIRADEFDDAQPAAARIGGTEAVRLARAWGAPGSDAPHPADLDMTPEAIGKRARTAAEVGIPTAAGMLLGPPAGMLSRAAIMALISGAATIPGLITDPPEDATAGAKRVAGGAALGAGGELAGLGLSTAARAAGPPLRRLAEHQAIHALGMLPSILRRLGSDFMGDARAVARTALDEGIVSPLASSETMAGRAKAISDRAGAELGNTRAAIDASGAPRVDAGQITGDVDQALNNWRAGRSDENVLNRHLGDTIQDVLAHSDAQATLGARDMAEAKQLLAGRANYHAAPNPNTRGADLAGQSDLARGVLQGAEEAHAAANLTPEALAEFMQNKQKFGAMQELINPDYGSLISRMARDAGNSQAGLLPTIAAAGRGDAASALATLVAARSLSQRGAQGTAVLANHLGNAALSPELRAALKALLQSGAQTAGRSRMEGLGLATDH